MITRMDNNIGLFLDELARQRAETNTIVIFTSIGGPQTDGEMNPKLFNSAGPLRGEAGSVYEGGIRVPMIIRWPARIEPRQASDFPWAAWDFLPTAAEIALINPPEKTDGISIFVLVGKGKTNRHESFYWDSGPNRAQQTARMGDWKIVRIGTNSPALYNLKADISERENIAGKNPTVLKKMEKVLDASAK